jgi:hypothetical protein
MEALVSLEISLLPQRGIFKNTADPSLLEKRGVEAIKKAGF